MENGVRPLLGFVTRIRNRRFVAKMQNEKVHDIEEKRMIGRIAALAAIAEGRYAGKEAILLQNRGVLMPQ